MECLLGCFYPTEVIFVDDSEIYLQTLEFAFEPYKDLVNFKTFLKAREALDYINRKKSWQNFPLIQSKDTFSANSYAVRMDLFSFHKQIYDAQRFDKISVVIADYDLGANQMNGVELCEQIKVPCVQKLLFTGQTSQDFVVDAFNAKKIDAYMQKQAVRSFEDMLATVKKMQMQYFLHCTRDIKAILKSDDRFPLAIYSEVFRKYFYEKLEQLNMREFYLIDAVGSALVIDDKNAIKVLMVQNKDQILANYMEFQEEFSPKQQELLKTGKSLYYNPNFWGNLSSNNTSYKLYPADIIEDKAMGVTFSCACIDDPDWIDRAQVQFLK